jgi:hypothetical protein
MCPYRRSDQLNVCLSVRFFECRLLLGFLFRKLSLVLLFAEV